MHDSDIIMLLRHSGIRDRTVLTITCGLKQDTPAIPSCLAVRVVFWKGSRHFRDFGGKHNKKERYLHASTSFLSLTRRPTVSLSLDMTRHTPSVSG